MAKPVQVGWDEGLICHLPLTTPKGHVRVRRDHQQLTSTRTTALAEGDLIEWEISYGRESELEQLLHLGFAHGLIKRERLKTLKEELIKQQGFYSDRCQLKQMTTEEIFRGFKVIYRGYPIWHKDVGNVSIEIEMRPRQWAVGYQPMLFLLIPIKSLIGHEDLIGKCACKKQVVQWRPSPDILFEVVRAFAIVSPQHQEDMLQMLSRISRILE